MPTFLVDECVPRDVHEAMARAGHAVFLVRDELGGAADEDVLRLANARGHFLITEDRRFGLLAISAGAPCGVVVLLMGTASPPEKAARLLSVLPTIVDSITDSVTVVGPTSVRRRPL